jgi:peptidoglycan-associated lipoprotein
MEVRRVQIVLILLSLLLPAACAKRPAMTQAAAPPPTGAAVTAPAPAPAPPPPAPVTPPAPPAAPPVAAAPPAPAPAPAPPRPEPAEFKSVPELRDVFFDFDRYDVRAGDKGTLDENAKWLKSNQGALLLIEGHADERGTNEYNLALGERRAKATRDYLVSVGIEAGRITVISYGEERPTCTDKTEPCWAKNRRAHFLVKQ